MRSGLRGICVAVAFASAPSLAAQGDSVREPRYDKSIDRLSRAHGVPERLIRRVIMRESRYAPHLTNRGHYGLMQIKLETAKGMGYRGGSAGLLDGDTNLTYAVPYLANAYLAADKNEDRAVQLYAGGYYYVAKHKGLLPKLRTAKSDPLEETTMVAYTEQQTAPEPPRADNPFASLFDSNAPAPASAHETDADPQDWALEGEELVIFAKPPMPPRRPAHI